MRIEEQDRVLENDKKNMIVSASAGSGKTHVMMQYITKLICEENLPVKDFLVLTFTKAAAAQMKERLVKNLKQKQTQLRELGQDDSFIVEQIDGISIADISTIHSFCEKCLKKHAVLLNLNENFSVVDEQFSLMLRDQAFENAYQRFENEFQQDSLVLSEAFKHDKKKICEIVKEVETLANSVADKDKFLSSNLDDAEKFFDDAIDFLTQNTKDLLQDFLFEVERLKIDEFQLRLKKSLAPIFESENLFEMSLAIESFEYPKHPRKDVVGNDVVASLVKVRERIRGVLGKISLLNLNEEESLTYQRKGVLEKILISLFQIYEEEEQKLKENQNCLDFYDLEKYMNILSQQENLFKGLKYVFVDEYQDTNKIQEKILKNVAKNCNFVAVGDAKQGIYGFRLASAEIFLKDLQEFKTDEDSAVNFLKCNFRSDQKLLDFVNDVFCVCMTQKLCGIDYAATSKLVQAKQDRFLDDGKKSVNIDIIAQSNEDTFKIPKYYSVKEAELYQAKKYDTLLKDIKLRILEALNSEISEEGVLRKVHFSDIAILSRNRNTLFNKLEAYLQESGIPVISNSREKLLSQPEMKMLLSFLKLALVFDDDVACLSVLLSGLYCKDLNQILRVKAQSELSLCQLVKQDLMFKDFMQDLQDFKTVYVAFGLRKALTQLFIKRNYRPYINLHHPNLNIFVDKFLEEVERFDYDLPGAINYFETVDITVTAEVSVAEDSVLLTTIHDSKGLEYPIVLLINCESDFSKTHPKSEVEINEKFGLAVKVYDQENNSEHVGARMLAIKQSQKTKTFIEELMIFYVALTRAKNRLYLFGLEEDFLNLNLKNCRCYFDLIFYALGKPYQQFLNTHSFENEIMQINWIEDVQEELSENHNDENVKVYDDISEEIENYLQFSYKLDEKQNFTLKESVTSLNNKNAEDMMQKFNNENFNFSEKAIEIGNAYHLALKAIDFKKVCTKEDFQLQIKENAELFDVSLIDEDVLLKNILLLKNFTSGGKVFKEKEFVMKEKICNLLESEISQEILVQGIVDLFVIKNDKAILIDYKYSLSTNDLYLKNKYQKQLKLYKIAVENAFNIKVEAAYLLSLKNAKLIYVEV